MLIEHDGDQTRLYRDDTVVANAWCDHSNGSRPRVCGEGTPIETIAVASPRWLLAQMCIRRIWNGLRLPS